MSLPDNRIRLQAAEIDFETQVGVTGQDHDSYPASGQQLRYDWMRLYLIGLLANQSSESEPVEFREGTLWFQPSVGMMVRYNDAWADLANVLRLGTDSGGAPITLADLYATIASLVGAKPTSTFSGSSSNDGVTLIPIPDSLRLSLAGATRPFLWINGLQIDPRLLEYVGGSLPSAISINGGVTIDSGDTFIVVAMSMASANFFSPEVSV